jgi:hypothetical protein
MKPTYTLIDLLLASPSAPMPHEKRTHQLTRMWGGLASIERAAAPTPDDWRVLSDAVNLMETLVLDMCLCVDASGLLPDAVAALAMAGKRSRAGGPIRLDAPGIAAVRAVLEDYAIVLHVLPHRTMLQCHKRTEARIRDIARGKGKKHDVEVMAL